MLLIVASMGCACIVSSAASGYLYYDGSLCKWLGQEMTFLCTGAPQETTAPATGDTPAPDDSSTTAPAGGSGGGGGGSSSSKKKCMKKCKKKKGDAKKTCEKKCK